MCLDRSNTENGLLTRFQELSRRSQSSKSDDDWATKVYDLCNQFWESLGDYQDQDTTPPPTKAFVALVQEDDAFAIAQMAIPEFRSKQTHPTEKIRNDILTSILVLRATVQDQARTQAHYDLKQSHYQLEKRIFHQAEICRAGHLLYDHDKLSSEEKEKVWDWVSARPKNEEGAKSEEAVHGSGSRGDLEDDIHDLSMGNKGGEMEQSISEADMYRMSLLIHNSGSLSPEQKKALRKWIVARPGFIYTMTSTVNASGNGLDTNAISFPPQSVRPLEVVDVLIKFRGALFEGDVFSVLWHLPFVIRSFEFALADGALDCNSSGEDISPDDSPSSWADRF